MLYNYWWYKVGKSEKEKRKIKDFVFWIAHVKLHVCTKLPRYGYIYMNLFRLHNFMQNAAVVETGLVSSNGLKKN